jgi:L-lactate dehydrogenase (cytochrome)
MHPAWWMNLLTTEPLKFASFASWDRTVGELMDYLLDPTMTIADLEWMRPIWSGPLAIKGVQTIEDARRVVDAGRMPWCCPITAAGSWTARRCRCA